MENLEKVYKKNTFLIILIGISGFCFGLLDWDSNLVDLFYLKYNHAYLVAIISANIGTARLIASIICIQLNHSRKPNFIFLSCLFLASIIALITAIAFEQQWLILFILTYLLEVIILEIFSGYQYAYVYHSLPSNLAMNAHSKRISLFKFTMAIGIMVAGFICGKYINHPLLIISTLATLVFTLIMLLVYQVKNFPKEEKRKEENLIKSLNIFRYTKYFRKWFGIRILGKFALSSLVVLLSLRVIDNNQNITMLKTVKSLEWILSGIGFFTSSYFIKKKAHR